jgi:hypothetical protein
LFSENLNDLPFFDAGAVNLGAAVPGCNAAKAAVETSVTPTTLRRSNLDFM